MVCTWFQVREDDLWYVHGRDRAPLYPGRDAAGAAAPGPRLPGAAETAPLLRQVHLRSRKVSPGIIRHL